MCRGYLPTCLSVRSVLMATAGWRWHLKQVWLAFSGTHLFVVVKTVTFVTILGYSRCGEMDSMLDSPVVTVGYAAIANC